MYVASNIKKHIEKYIFKLGRRPKFLNRKIFSTIIVIAKNWGTKPKTTTLNTTKN